NGIGASRMYTQHRSHFPGQRATVSCGSPTKFANDSRNEPPASAHRAISIRYKWKPIQSLNSFKTKADSNLHSIQILNPFKTQAKKIFYSIRISPSCSFTRSEE